MLDAFFRSSTNQWIMTLLGITPLFMVFLNHLIDIPGTIKRRIDVFSPQVAIAVAVFIGTTVRTFYLLFDPDGYFKMTTLVGQNLPEDILFPGLLAINLGIVCWMLFYSFRPRVRVPMQSSYMTFDPIAYRRVQIGMVLFGSTVMMMYLFKINFFENLGSYGVSGKRMFQVGIVEGNTTTFGYLRFSGDLLACCAIVQALYHYCYSRSMASRIVLVLLVLVGCIVPFAASARGEILYLALSVLIIRHYAVRRISPTFMLGFTLIAFILLGAMGILRQQAYRGADSVDASVLSLASDVFVYNAHFIGAGKTSVILSEIPSSTNFLYGKSYASTLIAPIPRVLWPEKPVVRIGRFVGRNLYHKRNYSGVPPGVIGEAYMNFGWPGIVVIMSLFGYGCARVYDVLVRARVREDIFRLGLYAILWITILDIATADFTGNVMRLGKYLVPFFVLAYFSFKPEMHHGQIMRHRPRRVSVTT